MQIERAALFNYVINLQFSSSNCLFISIFKNELKMILINFQIIANKSAHQLILTHFQDDAVVCPASHPTDWYRHGASHWTQGSSRYIYYSWNFWERFWSCKGWRQRMHRGQQSWIQQFWRNQIKSNSGKVEARYDFYSLIINLGQWVFTSQQPLYQFFNLLSHIFLWFLPCLCWIWYRIFLQPIILFVMSYNVMYLSVVSNFTHNFLNFAQIRPTIKFYYKEKLLLVCGKILPVVELQSSLVIILQIRRLFSKGLKEHKMEMYQQHPPIQG